MHGISRTAPRTGVSGKLWGRSPGQQPGHRAREARGWCQRRRIHMVAGKAVGVLDDSLLIDIH